VNADGEQPTVLLSNRQDLPVDTDDLHELATKTLLGEGIRSTELSVSFVEEPEIEALHLRYMNEPGPTDVLSFPLGEDGLLGDVVICPAYARRNNPELASELRLLLVHGILHLLGYDHQEEEERAEMWARQERYAGVRVQ
jgi:probable rRNA maturation factor